MNPVQTALNVSKSKITDQPIRNSIPNDDAKRPLRVQFQAISEFKPAESQCTCLISSQSLETHKGLFQEETSGSIIGRVICSSEAELSLRRGSNSMYRQPDQPGLSKLKQPGLGTELPAGGDTKQRRAVTIAVVRPLRLEEIPVLEAKPDAAADRPARNSDDAW